jgi:hypothetical protein
LCAVVSIASTRPPVSEVMNAVLPSAAKAIARGRGPTFMRPATRNDAVSTAKISLSASQVT